MVLPIATKVLGAAGLKRETPGKKPDQKTAGLSYEQRVGWLRRLVALSTQDGRSLASWKAEIEVALSGAPIFAELRKQVERLPSSADGTTTTRSRRRTKATEEGDQTAAPPPPPPPPLDEKEIAARLRETIDTAIRIVEGMPVALISDEFRAQVNSEVKDLFYKELRRVTPFVVVLLAGGTVFGAVHFSGIVGEVDQASTAAKREIALVKDDAAKAAIEAQRIVDSMQTNTKAAQEALAKLNEKVDVSEHQLGERLDRVSANISTAETGTTDLQKQVAGQKQALADLSAQLANVQTAATNASNVAKELNDFVTAANTIHALGEPARDDLISRAQVFLRQFDLLTWAAFSVAALSLLVTGYVLGRSRRTGMRRTNTAPPLSTVT
ncbi:hypothetical protein GCM10011611_46470 [Aliidongia dinghuensis]|uniref:Uncharacterized protein n=1 Tax=Aliidongia dinghuensis TaxID=1867774 RepID=A0A8J2YY73_9PROT|nr:hypothetical protein [Aliidongia dinghuensis]GGF34948.1 hypothetical protein GCM10011611_46470 [Aliidongia dinghuensis]